MTNKNKLTPSRVPNMSGSGTGPVKNGTPGGGVFKNKIFLFIFLPLMIIISAVTVFFIIKAINADTSVPVANSENYVYVLPMAEREADTGDSSEKNPFKTTGLSPVNLEGIMYNSDGSSYAILKSSSRSYVLAAGTEIGDTGWTLTEITQTSVTVAKGDMTENLTLQTTGSGGIETIPAM